MNEVEDRAVNMQALMEKVLESYSGEFEEMQVALVAEFPAHFPPIEGDEATLSRIIGDLIQFTITRTLYQEVQIQAQIVPSGGSPIPDDILTAFDEENPGHGPWALISISDRTSRLMDYAPGQGGDTSGTQPMVHAELVAFEVRLHEVGGALWSEGPEDQGMLIRIALPLQETGQHGTDVTRVRESVESRIGEGGELTAKLLVQAEDSDVRDALVKSLRQGGYEVISTQEGLDVIALAREERPDLIILDLQSRMPTAMEMALMIRQERSLTGVPILFLTEISGPGIGRRMEIVDLLVRPAGASAILETVENVLHSRLQPTARIMVVEPQDELREEMLATIQQQGYPVVEARSAEESLALAERVNLGVVLVRAELALDRDYWLVRQLHQLSEDIDIYLMSEGLPADNAQQALLRGAAGFGDTGKLGDLLDEVGN